MHPTRDTPVYIFSRGFGGRVMPGVMRLTQMVGKKTEDATAAELRRMLEVCPACGAHLHYHSYALFAITVASDERKKELLEFFHTLKAHDWLKARQFDDFDPLLNAAEAFVLKCVSGSLVLLMVRSPFELFDASNIMDFEVLDDENGKELNALIEADRWQML
jgi:hypothetical protein